MFHKLSALAMAAATVVMMACGDGMATYPDNDGIPNNCEYANAEYYQPNIFARFDNNHRRVVLVDWTTGETVNVLANDVDAANVTILSWSPNCRYLTVRQDGDGVIYDISNGAQVGTFPSVAPFHYERTSVTWDSTSTYVTVESERNTVLENVVTGAQFTLANYHFQLQYWDVPRGQLLAITPRGITTYDLNTGAVVAEFTDILTSRNSRIAFSPDYRLVAFYMEDADSNIVRVWDRQNMTYVDINTGYYWTSTVEFSADNRYLAMGGYTLSIWDLQNLPQSTDEHTPLYQYQVPVTRIIDLHFIDGTMIEVTDTDGTSFNWNFVTGERVG